MSGTEYLIDTNILIYMMQGNPEVEYFAGEEILAVSYITEMEALGKYQISTSEKHIISGFLNRCHIIEMNAKIKSLAIDIKQQTRIKLPDAIVAATAMEYRLLLVTADKDFEKVSNLNLLLMNIA